MALEGRPEAHEAISQNTQSFVSMAQKSYGRLYIGIRTPDETLMDVLGT